MLEYVYYCIYFLIMIYSADLFMTSTYRNVKPCMFLRVGSLTNWSLEISVGIYLY